jgi:purine-cytosine permease-like protein
MALAAILIWYLIIGVLAAIGSVTISRARFSPRVEHIVFALLLIPIAAMYLAFLAYFGDYSTFRPEARAVAVFTVLGLLGLRWPALVVLGYALHGGWDLVHEISVHLGLGAGAGGARPLTDIPLAYGVFCAAYDWGMAAYFHTRRMAWRRALE